MSAAKPSANLRVYLPSGQMYTVPVIPQTTLLQILQYIGLNPELFEGTGPDTLVFVNEGKTAMPNLERNMVDYNNWYVEGGFISSLYIMRCENAEHHCW
jgi:hypothetical protein